MKENNVEDCTRSSVKIDDENYYLVVGESFVQVTVPRENDPTMSKTRMIAETLCGEITTELKKIAQKRATHTNTPKNKNR